MIRYNSDRVCFFNVRLHNYSRGTVALDLLFYDKRMVRPLLRTMHISREYETVKNGISQREEI